MENRKLQIILNLLEIGIENLVGRYELYSIIHFLKMTELFETFLNSK